MLSFRKVVWAEGIMLAQQHFQQWDNYWQHQQQLTYHHLHSFSWGIAEMHWDEAFLAQGVFQLHRLIAVLQSGLWINFNQQIDGKLALKLPEQSRKSLKIYLALPATDYVSGISGYAQLQKPSNLEADYQLIRDQNDHQREREVLLGRQNLHLLLEEELKPDFNVIELAQLEYNDRQASYRLKESFVPPVLKISASSNLISWIAGFLGKMKQFLKMLHEQKEKHRLAHNQFGYADFIYFNLIKTLTTYLPQMELLLQSPHLPPFYLYSLCMSLIGELRGYTDVPLDEPDLPVFQLQSLSDVFSEIKIRFDELITRITPANTMDIHLQAISQTQYQTEWLEMRELSQMQFCLALHHENISQELIQRIMACIKIAAPSRLSQIVNSFIQGVELNYVASPGKDLMAKRDYHYFKLSKEGQEWQKIMEEGMISIFISEALASLTFELIRYE